MERFGGDIGGLVEAINAVMKEVSYIKETGKNTFHKYAYASDEDLLKALQPAMAENGLMLVPTSMESRVADTKPTKEGKEQFRTELRATYMLAHTSGGWMLVETIGHGVDGEDKGAFKAMTGALKYALRSTFLVPTGQDAERDPNDRRRETADDKRDRQEKHDHNWEADRAKFCAQVGEMDMKYDELCEFCEFIGRPRPSHMTREQRANLLRWIPTEQGTDKFREFLDKKDGVPPGSAGRVPHERGGEA